jgi:alpha-galactosidase
MYKVLLAFFLSLCSVANAQNNSDQLALTPPMGWNSWNFFEEKTSEQLLKEIADAMVSNGMAASGYQYIIIDDYWVGGRDIHNKLFPDPIRFPNGIKPLADYIHAKGLKLGIYSDAAELTCGGVTASYNFEEIDAATFAAWGVDYLKYDYCNAPDDVTTAFTRYKKMGDALKKTGRPMVYAICEWGQRKPWLWAKAAGGHLWRTTWDSRDVWQSNDSEKTGIMEIFDQQENLANYAGVGGWNDPDMLMVGLYGQGSSSTVNGRFKGCTATEYRTHFVLWCMLAAPLILNSDLRNIDPATLQLLTNKALLQVNQDALGHQATTVLKKDGIQVLKKILSNNEIAICIFNRSDKPVVAALDLQKDLNIWYPYKTMVDLLSNKTGKLSTKIAVELAAHDCKIYRLKAQNAAH